jgi:hypothetical protein
MEDEDLIDFKEARPAGLNSLRLPAFWVDKPVSWFVLAESHFSSSWDTQGADQVRLPGVSSDQRGCQPRPRRCRAPSGEVARYGPEAEPPGFTLVDLLPENRRPAQDGASGRSEPFGAVGFYAGALSSRPRDVHFLHPLVPREAAGRAADNLGRGRPPERQGSCQEGRLALVPAPHEG